VLSDSVRKHAAVVIALGVWLPGVAYGFSVLWRYSMTPGHPASPPAKWPLQVQPIKRKPAQATLLMFAHPQCGCSKASLGELAIIMARAHEKVSANVVFYAPQDEPATWARTDLWETAEKIPGVTVIEDTGNAFASSFGVFTSGQTLVYDSNGRLVFNGGITASRGHSGDNDGRDAIIALLQGHLAQATVLPVTSPVFGCSLRSEQ
jgi:hypothetical protein